MSLVIKYYTFIDPYTKTISKDYGWSTSNKVRKLKIKGEDILQDEEVDVAHEVVPRYTGLQEVSKAEFDATDVKGESATVQLRREAKQLRLEKLLEEAGKPAKNPLTTEQIRQKFVAAHRAKV